MISRVLAVAIIFAAALMALPIYRLYEELLANQQQQIDAHALAIVDRISETLHSLTLTTRHVASSQQLQDIVQLGNEDEIESWSVDTRKLFPNVVGLALQDRQGRYLGDPATLRISKLCERDTNLFIRGELMSYPPVHAANPELTHIDIMQKLTADDGQFAGLLLISYRLAVMQSILDNYAMPGYRYLLKDSRGEQIAAYGDGDYSYSVRLPVPETDWQLTIMTNNQLGDDHWQLIKFSLMTLIVVLASFFIVVGPYIGRELVRDISKVRVLLKYKNLDEHNTQQEDNKIRLTEIASLLDDIEELAGEITQTRSQLELEAYTDELTGLMNRRAFEISRGHLSRLAARQPVILALIDIDKFKHINDTYGHMAGDLVLKRFGTLLKDNVRSSDEIYRLGGDELLVVFTSNNIDYLQKWYANISAKLSKLHVRQGVVVTFSAGATQLSPGSDEVFTDAMMRADAALYSAKKAGRARLVVG
ncbi:MAG: sensor domain-containing diguanylate cyclase [Gammaproteobacteria bacterium]|nr:sensor domain-containing diguanylate cyclase [Gammaproteobacteria bacterium]